MTETFERYEMNIESDGGKREEREGERDAPHGCLYVLS
jgi:hypothetical protein